MKGETPVELAAAVRAVVARARRVRALQAPILDIVGTKTARAMSSVEAVLRLRH